jgi:sigma-B regulation protein RsbU (phosphoserine phosphatase)
MRATAIQSASAGECLEYVNSVLVRQSDPAMFVTIFYGVLHTDTGVLEYSIGGHNPPMLFSGSGKAELMETRGGMIVGMVEEATYSTGTIQLKPGDGILLYTDGVTEAEDPAENQFSEERLLGLLVKSGGDSVEDIVQEVMREVALFASGAPQHDDITAVALRYLG